MGFLQKGAKKEALAMMKFVPLMPYVIRWNLLGDKHIFIPALCRKSFAAWRCRSCTVYPSSASASSTCSVLEVVFGYLDTLNKRDHLILDKPWTNESFLSPPHPHPPPAHRHHHQWQQHQSSDIMNWFPWSRWCAGLVCSSSHLILTITSQGPLYLKEQNM